MFFEYVLLITFIQITVYKMNNEIQKGTISLRELNSLYKATLDSLEDINRYILGPPVLITIITGYVSYIIYVVYNYILFKGIFINSDVPLIVPIIDVFVKLCNIILLYWLCQATEKEV